MKKTIKNITGEYFGRQCDVIEQINYTSSNEIAFFCWRNDTWKLEEEQNDLCRVAVFKIKWKKNAATGTK